MFFKKKDYQLIEDKKLLQEINKIHQRLDQLTLINEHALDPSDDSIMQIKLLKLKYRFLYQEARRRNVNAKI